MEILVSALDDTVLTGPAYPMFEARKAPCDEISDTALRHPHGAPLEEKVFWMWFRKGRS